MDDSFKYSEEFPTRFVVWYKFIFWIKRWLRFFRIQKPVTKLLGPQYSPSNDLIEIDITYQCNLRCLNCNRSCTQAPESVHMPIDMIIKFVSDSLSQNKLWNRIRVLGGEPTLHPYFNEIVQHLLEYKKVFPDCKIEVVSNGYSRRTSQILAQLPEQICVENSAKTSAIQPTFGPFNVAPQDQRRNFFTDYSNGCEIMQVCGIGLTPQGYYPCAVAGGIDRVLGTTTGRVEIPSDNDSMCDLSNAACRLCGRFADGHYVPVKLRARLEEEIMSSSWEAIYKSWKERSTGSKDDVIKIKQL